MAKKLKKKAVIFFKKWLGAVGGWDKFLNVFQGGKHGENWVLGTLRVDIAADGSWSGGRGDWGLSSWAY